MFGQKFREQWLQWRNFDQACWCHQGRCRKRDCVWFGKGQMPLFITKQVKRKMNAEREKINKLYPPFGKIIDSFLKEALLKFPCFLIYGLRTFEEQERLYAKGRTAIGPKVTNAPAGYSWHNYGLAVDIAIIEKGAWAKGSDPRWLQLGEMGEKHGLEWGGRWKNIVDKAHFQKTYGFTLTELRKTYFELTSEVAPSEIMKHLWAKIKEVNKQ